MVSSIIAKFFLHKTKQLQRFGNDYGGFSIINNINDENSIVWSFGIGEDLSFSEDIIKSCPNVNIYAFDPTPKSIEFVKNSNLANDKRFHFYPIGLSYKNGSSLFYLPQNEKNVSGSLMHNKNLNEDGIVVKMRNLKYLAYKLDIYHINLLKMDIEGSEFDVINTLSLMGISIDQICLETHERFKPFLIRYFYIIKMFIEMKKMGYILICKEMDDFTFIKREILRV